MPHLLLVDIDDSTLVAIEELVHSRALIATLALCKLDDQKVQHLAPNGADIEPLTFRINGFSPPRVESRTLIFACWRLDLVTHELRTADDALVPLSRAEFELLYVLAKHPHRRLTRRQILDFMKGHARLSRTRSIDVYVSRLRCKLEVDIRSPKIVQTVRNGYTFSAAVTIG